MSNRLFEANSRLVSVTLNRVGGRATVRRRGGGKLAVPAGATYTVESGETVRFEETEVDGALEVLGTLIVDDEGTLESKYGKLTDDRAGVVLLGEFNARRIYPSAGREASREQVRGGARTSETPDIAFPLDSDVQENDRVTFPDGEEYELQSLVHDETHLEFAANLMTS